MRHSFALTALWSMAIVFAEFLPAASALAQPLQLQTVKSGFSSPVFATQAPGDPSRLFVVEQGGLIKTINLGNTAAPTSTFLNLGSLITSGGEQGLLGLAFAPDYSSTGRFYSYYTGNSTGGTAGDLVVARHQAVLPGGSSSYSGATSASTGTQILRVPHPGETNHNGGWIGFRPGQPNNLYVATGDGGGGNDPNNNAQNRNSLLGKMLRLDVSGATSYTSPASNPFFGATAGADEIWAMGLRNPYRNSFDKQTGDFWIADVGQGAREEVNFEPAASPGGVNYGWDVREGTIAGPSAPGVADGPLTNPLLDYDHGVGRSITGGYVNRGSEIPGYEGTYFFADFFNRVFTYTAAQGRIDRTTQLGLSLSPPAFNPSSFAEGLDGDLYLIDYGNTDPRSPLRAGAIHQIVPEPSTVALLIGGGVCGGLALIVRKRRNSRLSHPAAREVV